MQNQIFRPGDSFAHRELWRLVLDQFRADSHDDPYQEALSWCVIMMVLGVGLAANDVGAARLASLRRGGRARAMAWRGQ